MRVKIYLKSGRVISYLLSPEKERDVANLKHEVVQIMRGDMTIEDSFVNFLEGDMIDAKEVAAITISDSKTV